MPIKVYQFPASPPCRAVFMTAEHLGIEIVKKHVNLFIGEQLTPQFIAINPQHTLPTIDDDGFYLWEGRAILAYLVNKYAPGNSLYPEDPKERAVVDKMLYFHMGHISKAVSEYMRPQVYEGRGPTPEEEESVKNAMTLFEKLLEDTTYAAGNNITIADYSILSDLVTLEILFDYSYNDFPKISAWLEKMKAEAPHYADINEIPLKEARNLLDSRK